MTLWPIFFGSLIKVLGGVKVEKVFESNYSRVELLWFETFRRQHILWPFCHCHLGIFCEDGHWKPFTWSFFCSAIVTECSKQRNLNALLVSTILHPFEVDLFWRKSPFLVIDSYRTKYSCNKIECVLGSHILDVQNKLLTLYISLF